MIEIKSNKISVCENPVYSVAMIAYNHAPFIAEAIEGVIKQKCKFDIELIIGEDCSTDETMRIAREYQERYPKVIRIITYEKNVGVHSNMRAVLEAARGKYIAFCEGDDYWIDPEKIQTEYDIFNNDKAISIVHGDHVFRQDFWGKKFLCQPRGRYFYDQHKERLHGDIRAGVAQELVTHTCTMSFPAALIKSYLVSEESRFPGGFYDRSLVAYCSIHGLAAYIDKPVAAYRIWGKSMMRSGEIGTLKLGYELFQYFYFFGEKHPNFKNLYTKEHFEKRAKSLYLRSILLKQDATRKYFERYFLTKKIDVSDIQYSVNLNRNLITGFIFKKYIASRKIKRDILSKVKIFIGIDERKII